MAFSDPPHKFSSWRDLEFGAEVCFGECELKCVFLGIAVRGGTFKSSTSGWSNDVLPQHAMLVSLHEWEGSPPKFWQEQPESVGRWHVHRP